MEKLKNESGRSMIEMLGVLAIIGVLSVGGIAGYRAAMTQHKLNLLFQDIEIERVDAVEEMNRENPQSYTAETKNSGTFVMAPNCGSVMGQFGECYRLDFSIKDQDVCEAFKKQAPDNWLMIVNLHNYIPPMPLSRLTCDTLPAKVMLGFMVRE